MTPLVI
jgi:hypothetical protein